MSSTNGQAHVAAEMREPVRPLRAAELSSIERNALLDSLVAVVNTNARAMSELRDKIDAIHPRVSELENGARAANAQLDAHAGILLRPTLWARLRWLVTGR